MLVSRGKYFLHKLARQYTDPKTSTVIVHLHIGTTAPLCFPGFQISALIDSFDILIELDLKVLFDNSSSVCYAAVVSVIYIKRSWT